MEMRFLTILLFYRIWIVSYDSTRASQKIIFSGGIMQESQGQEKRPCPNVTNRSLRDRLSLIIWGKHQWLFNNFRRQNDGFF